MRLRAYVKRVTGNTVHRLAKVVGRAVVPVEDLPPPVWVEIEPIAGGACLLHYFAATGIWITDTFHMTPGDAKRQAKFKFGIESTEWFEIPG